MHIDARTISQAEAIRTSVAVLGAGAAGTTVAMELADAGVDVCLLESGGFDFDDRAQELAGFIEAGIIDKHQTVNSRRAVGGTTWHWGGCCRPLDPIDFERRDWVPLSGWPIGASDLEPWYRRAGELCELRTRDGGPPVWDARQDPGVSEIADARLDLPVIRYGMMNFAHYAHALRVSRRATVVTHATVLDLALSADLDRVAHLVCTNHTGRRFYVEADAVVLACGGIETPRLLLRANHQVRQGVGNEHGWVGRCLMQHPTVEVPFRILSTFEFPRCLIADWDALNEPDMRLKREKMVGYAWAKLAPSAGEQRRRRILSGASAVFSFFQREPTDAWRDLARFVNEDARTLDAPAFDVAMRGMLARVGDLRAQAEEFRRTRNERDFFFGLQSAMEQSPNPQSRVTLGDEVDSLGCARARVDWRLNDLDRASFRGHFESLSDVFEAMRWGRFAPDTDFASPDWPGVLHGGFHYTGTARMSDGPRSGVVDRHCRVHAVDNLYVAGSAAFPTCGHAPPTLTIVALAARLAAHLHGGRPAAVREVKSIEAMTSINTPAMGPTAVGAEPPPGYSCE